MHEELIMDSFLPDVESSTITNKDELIETLEEGKFVATFFNDVYIDYDEYEIKEPAIFFYKNDIPTCCIKIEDLYSISVNKIRLAGENNEK